MRMTWSELLFAHWPLEPAVVAQHLPAGLELDTRAGQAWVGVVPFLMSDVAPRCCPSVPKLSRFLELNLRTYVRYQDKPGVWFFSLEAENRLAVRMARAIFHLPYMDAKMSLEIEEVADDSGQVTRHHYRSHRTHRNEPLVDFDASYQAEGEPFKATPGSLEHWLTARYCLYCADRRGNIYRGEIDHAPWTLKRATWNVRANSIGHPWQFQFSGQPHLLYAAPVKVHAWLASRV